MQKTTIAMSLLLALSGFSQAQDIPDYDGWVGGFAEYYDADHDKPEPVGYMDDGEGLGAEFGFKFKPQWAVRLELSHLKIDGINNAPEESGNRVGIDAMYFLPDDLMYVFAGLKHERLDQSYRLGNVGIGKHWKLTDKWRVITEAAAYHDFGQDFRDYSVKLGLAYTFGGKSSYKPAPIAPVSKDSDNDGVYDGQDQCPNTPVGVKVDNVGCSVDLDGDGVINSQDMCPDTPAGTAVGLRGCSIELDTDQDGVLDKNDQCPDTPLTDKVDSNGCSVFMEKELSVSLNVLFDNNSASINNPDDVKFVEFAEFMQRFPNTKATIEGHTSAVGDANYNQQLSEKRANAVVQLLVQKYAIDASRLNAIGYGESRLLDSSNSAEASKKNRRIEAKVTAMEKVKVSKQ